MMDVFSISVFSVSPAVFIAAFALDALIGDPMWLPHPVRVIGWWIIRLENILKRGASSPAIERFKGLIFVIAVILPVFAAMFFICLAIANSSPSVIRLAGICLAIYIISTTIAANELISSVKKVIKAVKAKDIDSARNLLSMIVGRDTERLNEKDILKAAIETLSENLSDGVIAPIFYLAMGGIPLAMAYKAVNTMDSMVGYKNDKYRHFGWAAARLDDMANYIPARITGIIIVVSSAVIRCSISDSWRAVSTMFKDGRKHSSPNSGFPEAAIAGALGVCLGGASTYGGVVVDKPFIGVEITMDYLSASDYAVQIARVSCVIGAVFFAIMLYLRSFI
jgi:adenosylcobinamide-phosphate synthase